MLAPKYTDDNFFAGAVFATPGAPAGFAARFTNNVQMYSLGASGANVGGFQTNPAAAATDGNPPISANYDAAYEIADKIDLFNLMVLPPDAAVPMTQIYPNASVFCEKRRAFLIMDPPANWTTTQIAAADVKNVRIGVSKQYSAIYYPRLIVEVNKLPTPVGPAGAIAGLYGRIDTQRGVWKAPAGTEADLRGLRDSSTRFQTARTVSLIHEASMRCAHSRTALSVGARAPTMATTTSPANISTSLSPACAVH